MRRALHGAAFLLVAVAILPGFAADEKKADPKKDLDKKDSGLVKAGAASGTISRVDEGKKILVLRIEVPKLNPNAVAALNQAQLELQQARTPAAIQAAMNKINQNKANMYTKDSTEVELGTTDDCIVRLGSPPPKFDDKGKIVRYSKKELDELKGDNKKLPGFKGEFSDLHSNQVVQVQLMRPKVVAKPMPIKPKNKDAGLDLMVDNKLQASMIIVLGEPKQPGQ